MAREYRGKSVQSLEHEDKLRRCPECGCEEFEFEEEEMFCKKCGLVIE